MMIGWETGTGPTHGKPDHETRRETVQLEKVGQLIRPEKVGQMWPGIVGQVSEAEKVDPVLSEKVDQM